MSDMPSVPGPSSPKPKLSDEEKRRREELVRKGKELLARKTASFSSSVEEQMRQNEYEKLLSSTTLQALKVDQRNLADKLLSTNHPHTTRLVTLRDQISKIFG